MHTADTDFSYAKMHATPSRGLTHDTTVIWCLLSREPLQISA